MFKKNINFDFDTNSRVLNSIGDTKNYLKLGVYYAQNY